MFRKFEPTKYMLISRDTAMINDYFSITKSQLIDLCHFCTIDATENDRPEIWVRDKKIYDANGDVLAVC
jgi:hypothetical protein